MTDINSFLTIFVSICALGISFLTFWNKTKSDSASDKANDARVMTKLEFISDDLKDLKAEYRSTRNEIKEVREIAEHARERAESAHSRLDRAKIDIKDKGDDKNGV